jgi:hypothetical protein
MARKLLSVLGIFAMLIAFLPRIVDAATSSDLPSCCLGVMCPLHQMPAAQPICGNLTPRDGVIQSCPDQTTHYTGALQFVRVVPSFFFSQRVVRPAFLPAPPTTAKIDADVPFLPPRPSSL